MSSHTTRPVTVRPGRMTPHTSYTRFGICSQHISIGAHAFELLVGDGYAVWVVGRWRRRAVVGLA